MFKIFTFFIFVFVLFASNVSMADERSIIVDGVIRPTLDQFFWYGRKPTGRDMIRRGYNTAWDINDYHKREARRSVEQESREAVRRQIEEEQRAYELRREEEQNRREAVQRQIEEEQRAYEEARKASQ
jgi:hypothetical protein